MGRVARHCARLANPARFFRLSACPCVLRYDRNGLPPRYPLLSLPFACPFIVLSLGIRAASAGRDARKDAENQKVRLVGGEERLDACLWLRGVKLCYWFSFVWLRVVKLCYWFSFVASRAGSPWGLPPTAPTDPDVHINASGSSRCGVSLSLTRLGRFAVTRR
jgi:hypothetical protein